MHFQLVSLCLSASVCCWSEVWDRVYTFHVPSVQLWMELRPPLTHTHTAVASTRRACVLAWQAIRNHHRVDLWWEAQSDTLDHTRSHIHILTHTLPRVCQCCRLIWLTGAWGFTWPFFPRILSRAGMLNLFFSEFSPLPGYSTQSPLLSWLFALCLHFFPV